MEEIKRAVFSLPKDKSPGPDGFSMCFYQTYWEVIKFDLLSVFQDFYSGTADLKRINYAHIVLVSKVVGANLPCQFRLISLLNCSYKLITKVLANRLANVINLLVDKAQVGFLRNRFILDNVAIAQEVISEIHDKKLEGILLKIDFEKAYDKVNWDFLLELLKARGFSLRWIGWINACLRTGVSSVLVNGIEGRKFVCKRGLRQGDPLSPLLFVLVADVFARMLLRSKEKMDIRGLGNFDNGILTLQYADDTILFSMPQLEKIRNLKLILYLFENVSGLNINFNKSEAIWLEGDEEKRLIAKCFNCRIGKMPLVYLGIPIKVGRMNKEDWRPLLDKVEKLLPNWKGACLSRGGRLTLVNSVLSDSPSYWMSYFRLPCWLVDKIDGIRRAFSGMVKIRCLVSSALGIGTRSAGPNLKGDLGS